MFRKHMKTHYFLIRKISKSIRGLLLVLLLLPLFRLGAVLELSMAISLSPSHVCLYIRIISELTVHAIVYNMVDRAYVTNLVYMCFSPSVWLCTRALGTES